MTQSENCPACEQLSVLACKRMHEELIYSAPDDDETEEDAWVSHVKATYQALEFHCGVCGLVLRGRDELTAAGIDVDIESVEELEPEFAEEYGNE
jgi:transcription elongation factor Elf1